MNDSNIKYKETSIGLIPTDWEVKSINNCFDILDNKRKPLNDSDRNKMKGKIPYYGANGIVDYVNDYLFDEELILIAEDGGYFDEYQTRPIAYKVTGKSWVNNHAHILKSKGKYDQDYLFYTLEHRNILLFLNGGTRAKLNKGELEKIPIPIPPIPEQRKIANIISTWDLAIDFCKSTLEALLKRKKWLARELLSNKKANANDEKVKHLALSKLVDRVKNQLSPEPGKLYKQIGIRSHCKGIFYKEDVTGKSLGNKSVFYIEPDCFIVNIVFAWEHAIAKTTVNEVGMIASHRFPMFKPKANVLDLNYMLNFFKSKKGKDLLELASPGGAGRNKTLGQSEFLRLQIPVPDIKKQKLIAEVLDKADYEILLYQKKATPIAVAEKGFDAAIINGKNKGENKLVWNQAKMHHVLVEVVRNIKDAA